VNEATGGLYNYGFVHIIACRNRKGELSRRNAKIRWNLYFEDPKVQKAWVSTQAFEFDA